MATSGEWNDDELGVDAITGRVLCQFNKKFGSKEWSCKKTKVKHCNWTEKVAKRFQGSANS